MTRSRSLRLILVFTALVATGGGALAQSAMCRQYRAELASLPANGGASPEAGRLAQQQLAELQQMLGYYRALQCDRAALFGPAPECGSVAQRIRAMEANYGALVRRSHGDVGTEQRRRRLNAAIDRHCTVERPTPETERLTRIMEEEPRASRRSGSGRMVCVRSCDGFFFPLQNLPSRADADDMCQALCPGSETAAYSMPADGEISQAVSMRGKAYSQLANALKYTTRVDPACACRKPGQSWAQALARAETMLTRNRSDIVVTAAKAEELSRPALLRPKVDRAKRNVASRPQQAFTVESTGSVTSPTSGGETAVAARTGEAAPTAGRESSGIGEETPKGPRVVPEGEGPSKLEAAPTGTRKVRLIAPDVVAVPRTER